MTLSVFIYDLNLLVPVWEVKTKAGTQFEIARESSKVRETRKNTSVGVDGIFDTSPFNVIPNLLVCILYGGKMGYKTQYIPQYVLFHIKLNMSSMTTVYRRIRTS